MFAVQSASKVEYREITIYSAFVQEIKSMDEETEGNRWWCGVVVLIDGHVIKTQFPFPTKGWLPLPQTGESNVSNCFGRCVATITINCELLRFDVPSKAQDENIINNRNCVGINNKTHPMTNKSYTALYVLSHFMYPSTR